METIQKCQYCGKEYIKNINIPENLPEYIKQKIQYIPSCDCLEKKRDEEQERQWQEMRRQVKINRVKKYRDISVLDENFTSTSFDNADMTSEHMKLCKTFAEELVKKGCNDPVGLMLYGNVGTGKTYGANCVARYLMRKGKTVLVMSLGLYLVRIMTQWDDTEPQVLDYVKDCDLLIIDDFGAEHLKEFGIEKVFNLIDTRYRAGKPLIITTNLSIEEIARKFGSRIADRISSMCYQVTVLGESRRKDDGKDNFFNFIMRG